MQSEHGSEQELTELGAMLQDIRVAMLTTVARNGWLVSRPLYTRSREFDGDLYFFVAIDSGKVDQLVAHPDVNLAYADPEHDRYISIAGQATMLQDRRLIDALWNERFDRLYFKGGRDDPSLALLRVHVLTADVWSAGDSSVTRAFNFVAAMITGDGGDLGEQRHIDLRSH